MKIQYNDHFSLSGWLEPLLAHVTENSSNVAVPVLDIIDDDTFAYKAFDLKHIRIGGFDWSLEYKWVEIPDREKPRHDDEIDPIRFGVGSTLRLELNC